MKINIYINKFVFACLMVFSLLVTGCKDDDNEKPTGILPEATTVTPIDGLKPGNIITISGTKLDLVKQVRIGDAVLVNRINFVSASDTKIEITIPNNALAGDLFLVTFNNTQPNIKTVHLNINVPEITGVSPLEIFPGDMITVSGTDLDMITTVQIEDLMQKELNHVGTTKLEAVFSYDLSKGGILKFTTVNGQEISFPTPIVVKKIPAVPVITEVLPQTIKPGQTLVIRGKDLDQVSKVTFEENIVVTSFISQAENIIEVQVPADVKKGVITVMLETIYGDTANTKIEIATGVDTIVDPELVIFDFENEILDWGLWNGIGKASTADGVSGKYYEITSATWKDQDNYWFFATNSMTHASVSGKSNYWVKMDIRLRQDIPIINAEIRLMLSGTVVNILPYLQNVDETHWSTNGDWKTIAIPLSAWSALSDPTPTTGGEWGMTCWNNGANFTGFCIDNVRYEVR